MNTPALSVAALASSLAKADTVTEPAAKYTIIRDVYKELGSVVLPAARAAKVVANVQRNSSTI